MSTASAGEDPGKKGGGASFAETKEFLRSVFQSATTLKDLQTGEDSKVMVEDVEIEGGSNLGDNYGSAMVFANVKLRTGKGLEELGVVIKSLKETRWHVEVMNIFELFKKEVEFYSKVIPAIVKFQAERGVRRQLGELVPKCLFARADGDEHIVITEDLRRKGFKMADRHRGLGLRHSLLALEALGRFHAASLAMKILQPEAFWEASRKAVREANFTEDRKTLLDSFYNEMSRGHTKKVVAAEVERGAEDAALLLRVSDVAEKVIKERCQLFPDLLAGYREPLAVINHGDSWVNNIMYRYEKNEKMGEEVPVAVKFVDFQMTRYGSPALDLHTFLCTSTTLQLRREHEDLLLRTYHGSLLDGLREAGVKLPSLSKHVPSGMLNGNGTEKVDREGYIDLPDSDPLSFRALKEDLDRYWTWGLILAEIMLRIVLGDSSEAGNALKTTMTNNAAVQENENKDDKLVGCDMLKQLSSKAYDERYLEVIREFAHKGYFDNQRI